MRMLTRWARLRHIGHYNGRLGGLTPSLVNKRLLSSPVNDDGGSNTDQASRHELIYPSPPSAHHHDLASFAAYARRSGLDVKSTVYVGTHYEYTVAATLGRYGFSLRRVGGASDRGTDLLGTWTPPTATRSLRVLVQCKAGAQRVGPSLVRELEGAFAGAPPGWRGGPGVLALLASQSPATKGVREALGRSRWPMAFVCCSGGGVVRQMLWNRRAEEEGLLGFGVTTRHTGDAQDAELVLLRDGKILPFVEV
jgi:hypothetical protein